MKQRALFDTGATDTSLSLKAARRAGIKTEDMAPVGRVVGAGEGKVSSWMAPVDLIELGGEKIRNSRLRVDDVDFEYGLLVGMDYFLSHRIYVSRLQQRVYITWNGTPIFSPGGGAANAYNSRYAALPQDVAADDADALARRGAATLAAGEHSRALDDLNRACELMPAVAGYRMTRAQIHLRMNNDSAAMTDFDEALRLDPALAQARFDRAVLLHRLEHQPASLADLKLLDSQLPPSADLRTDMAELFAAQDQMVDALKQFALWLESHPRNARRAQTLNSRCWLRLRHNQDLELSLEDTKKSVDLDEGDANARDCLGWVYLRMVDLRRAKRAFDASIKLEPLAFSFYGRSLVHLRSGDKAQSDWDLAEARRLESKIDLQVREQGFAEVEGVEKLAATAD